MIMVVVRVVTELWSLDYVGLAHDREMVTTLSLTYLCHFCLDDDLLLLIYMG